jgi:hypothetical protein
MPLYIVLQGQVSVYKPAPIIVDEKSPQKAVQENTQVINEPKMFELPSRNLLMSHQTLKTKTTFSKEVIPEDPNEDFEDFKSGSLTKLVV